MARRPVAKEKAARRAADKAARLKMQTDVGKRLRVARRALDILKVANARTQEGFAKSLGIAKNSYNAYETGLTMLPPDDAAKILARHHVDLNWLYTGETAFLVGPLYEAIQQAQRADDA